MTFVEDVVDYFFNPLKEGYTPQKTAVYALTLLVAMYGVFYLLKKLKIKVDSELATAISPFIILGGLVRVMFDRGILDSELFVTPGIYMLIFSAVMVIMTISKLLERKFGIPYFKPMFVTGFLAIVILGTMLNFANVNAALLIFVFYLPWMLILYKIKWNLQNKIVTLVQMLDATATFVAMTYFGYIEQHVVPTLLIGIFTPVSFIFVKVAVVIAVLFAVDKFADKEFGSYLKLVIGILGAAPAARDLIELFTMV